MTKEIKKTKEEKVEELVKETIQMEQEAAPVIEVVKAPTQSIEKLVDGKKYYIMHERGEYSIYEKRPNGNILIQVEQDRGKASKLFSQLEGFATRYRAAELGIGVF